MVGRAFSAGKNSNVSASDGSQTLTLHTGQFIGKDTGVTSTCFDEAYVPFACGIQPDVLGAAFSATAERNEGFLQRFLLVHMLRLKVTNKSFNEVRAPRPAPRPPIRRSSDQCHACPRVDSGSDDSDDEDADMHDDDSAPRPRSTDPLVDALAAVLYTALLTSVEAPIA